MGMKWHGLLEIVFADHLKCFKDFRLFIPNSELHAEMRRCQHEFDKCVNANQVSFVAAKISKHILALHSEERHNFRLLGVPFDYALSMRDAVGEIVSEAAWKIASVLRSACFFTDDELVNLYRTKLISYLEYRTATICHVCGIVLVPLDKFQNR